MPANVCLAPTAEVYDEGELFNFSTGSAGFETKTLNLPDARTGLTLLLLEWNVAFASQSPTFDLAMNMIFEEIGPTYNTDRNVGIRLWEIELSPGEISVEATAFTATVLVALLLNSPRDGAFGFLDSVVDSDFTHLFARNNGTIPTPTAVLTPTIPESHQFVVGMSKATGALGVHPSSPASWCADVAQHAGGAFDAQGHIDIKPTFGVSLGAVGFPGGSYDWNGWLTFLAPLVPINVPSEVRNYVGVVGAPA